MKTCKKLYHLSVAVAIVSMFVIVLVSCSSSGDEAGVAAGGSLSSATISGDGVSPAARAAARRSPPGRAAATASADAGRREGLACRQRRITFSTSGSRSLTSVVGLTGVLSARA